MSLSAQTKILKELNADWFIHVFPDKRLAKAARKAGIKNRVGTSHRVYHWINCNKNVSFSRRRSALHEAQLNCCLLKPLGINIPGISEIKNYYGFRINSSHKKKLKHLLDNTKKNFILHPKSKGSAREWGLDNFDRLIKLMPDEKFKIFVSGTSGEATLMKDFLDENKDRVTDLTGKLTLDEFIEFLSMVDGIVAASTGPLHLAAALGRIAIGIYPPIRPMHPGRWAPLGEKAKVLVTDVACEDCRKNMDCHCIREISPEDVLNAIHSS
jgi:heptosyltransferase-3